MVYASATERHALITGLRDLADFLERNPDVPAPPNAHFLVFPPSAPDDDKRREVDMIASLIGSGTVLYPRGNHYVTSRRFGPVEYRAVAIPADKYKEQW